MRATTWGTLYTSFAICDAMMLRLSPSVTATNPSARSMPARRRTSTSVPLPTTWSPLNSRVKTPRVDAREKAFGSLSTMTTSWPARSMLAAICEPTRPHPTMRSLNAGLIIGTPMDALRSRACRLLGFGRVRFPFTFMGVMALAIGLWVVVYLAGHRTLDPVAQELAGGTAVICFGFAAYVFIRRVRRGPQH